MEFLNYFGMEDLLITAFELAVLIVFFITYLRLRKSASSTQEPWVVLLKNAVGFVVLSIALPFALGLASIVLHVGISENYLGIIVIFSMYVPIAFATFYIFKLGVLACSKA